MKNLVALVCVLCVVAAIPVPESKPQSSLDLLQIPLGGNKELDILSLADENGKITERNKRTIDILRQLFPTLTQIIEAKIQAILPILIRTVGPLLLRGAAGGGAGGNAPASGSDDDDDDFNSEVEKNTSNSGGRKVSVSLPTFEVGADDDDEDEEATPVLSSSSSASPSTTTTTEAQSSSFTSTIDDDAAITRIDLPTTLDDAPEGEQPKELENIDALDKIDTENQIV